MEPPINVPVDEKNARRIERQEKAWTSGKLVVVALISLAIAVTVICLMGSCELTPLPKH